MVECEIRTATWNLSLLPAMPEVKRCKWRRMFRHCAWKVQSSLIWGGWQAVRHPLQPTGWGLNIEFEPIFIFGGTLRWLIHLQTGIWILSPQLSSCGFSTCVQNWLLTTWLTARTLVTSNEDWSRKMGLGNRCLLWFPVYTPIQCSCCSTLQCMCLTFHGGMGGC